MFHNLRMSGYGVVILAACAESTAEFTPVKPGIDVLVTDSIHLVSGARVGLLTNQTGVSRDGTSDIEVLLGAGVNLTTLFSPEHGFRGVLEQATVADSRDEVTGLPIYSLYGETRAPTPAMLDDVDVLVIDLQDIGARTYTYISTALLAMRVAAETQTRVIVLDRPNPIGGVLVQGPMMTRDDTSFIGMLQVPLRHGMTLGELALYGKAELSLETDLTVVPAEGWRREAWFDQTGLPWVRPSPSMPSLESAAHYPGLVLFEASNLSVGRGTPVAFQTIAAPWLLAGDLVRIMGEQPGVALTDTTITPRDPPDNKYPDLTLTAVLLRVTDRAIYDPVMLATSMMTVIYAMHKDQLEMRWSRLDRLSGSRPMRRLVGNPEGLEFLRASWELGLSSFITARAPFLLY